jgi:ribosomal protein L37AE/L43A
MRTNPKTVCPLCTKGELRKIAYDLYYCDYCKEEYALNDQRGMLWYKKSTHNFWEHDYVVIKKLTAAQLHTLRSLLKD